MRRPLPVILLFVVLSYRAAADEGMWPLPLFDEEKVLQIEGKGLVVPFEDIYRDGGGSLADAVVIFGRGGTGSVISPDGLVLTNHHCAYDEIRGLSTPGNNILKDGFWASGREGELPVPGLSVTFIRRMEDVTEEMTEYIFSDSVNLDTQDKSHYLLQKYREAYNGKDVSLVSLFEGNRYLLLVVETYKDVRLVGTPPESIGKFGGETDNWIWPRYTGDFALFRIYTAQDGAPADYSLENIPFFTPDHLRVSTGGYSEGDFTMTLGFPGLTKRYLTKPESDMEMTCNDVVAAMRKSVLEVLAQAVDDEAVRMKYAAKYATASNVYKYFTYMREQMGRSGIRKNFERRQTVDARAFNLSVKKGSADRGGGLSSIGNYIADMKEGYIAQRWLIEFMYNGMDIFGISRSAAGIRRDNLLTKRSRARLESEIGALYSNYDTQVDKAIARAMVSALVGNVSERFLPRALGYDLDERFGGDVAAYVDYLYDNSYFTDAGKCIESWFDKNTSWSDDPVSRLWSSFEDTLIAILYDNDNYYLPYRAARRRYAAVLMKNGGMRYPDANGTMRLSYGSVEGYGLDRGAGYGYFTTLEDMVFISASNASSEYAIPHRLNSLAEGNPVLHVNFLTNNDITGGNSGSPVLNSKGELIGLAFDGNKESTAGFFDYDPKTNRCVCVDMRYIMFIVDRFAGAGHLLQEMSLSGR